MNTILISLSSFFKKVYSYASLHKITTSVAVLIILGTGYYFLGGESASAVTYQYTTVVKGDIRSVVSATGQVTPNSQVDLKPKVNANVTGVYVRSGDRVKVGQVLFRLDATDAYKQVRDAKTSLESANIALEKLRTPQTIDVLSITNSLTQEEDSKKDQDTKVATAYRNLLSANLVVIPAVSYTTETAPTLSGSYTKGIEGQIKISVYQGGYTGYSFSLSGAATGQGSINTLVPQPLGDTGLYIKWNSTVPQTNWIIDIPNKQSSNYLSNYTTWQNAVDNRETANAASDRNIESLKQRLADLTPGDDDLDIQSAKLQVTQRQNALLDAQTELSNYVITAPFDGVMASVSVDIGSSAVMASANSSTALGTIVTDKKLASITLNEADIAKVRLGQKATISFDAVEGLSVPGTVVEITTLGTVTSGVVTYKVKVTFDADDVRIFPNMSVSVDILTDSKENVLYVPNQAVKRDDNGFYVEKDTTRAFPQMATSTRASSTETGIATLSRNGRREEMVPSQRPGSDNTTTTTTSPSVIIRVPITIGVESDTQTEILSGLVEGETIILKKIIGTAGEASAPSVTSLFRPQGRTTTGASGNTVMVRPQ